MFSNIVFDLPMCVTAQYFNFLMHNYFSISLFADIVVTFCMLFFNMWCYSPSTWGLGCLIVEVSGSHTIRYTHPVGLLWMSDQLNAEAATYQHNKHVRQTSMPSAGFKLMIPAIEELKTYALDCTATGIGTLLLIMLIAWMFSKSDHVYSHFF